MKMQKIIRISLVVVWMLIIFSFSQVKGEKSYSTSTGLIKDSVININKVLVKIKLAKPISDKRAANIAKNLNYPIRKLMHITEYFILALLLYWTIILYKTKKTYLLTFILSVLYAISDEIHQLFRARTGQVKDVFIDTIGILIAILFIKIIKKIKTKHA